MRDRRRLCDRLILVVLCVCAILLPVLLVPWGWDAWRFPKVLVLRAVAILLLMMSGLVAVWSSSRRYDIRRFRSDPLSMAGAGIILWVSVATVTSPQPSVSLWALTDVVAGLTIFYSARRHAFRTGRRTILYALLLPACINGVVVALQYFDLWHPLVGSAEALHTLSREDAGLLRQAALLGNRDDVGMYLMFPCLVSIYLAMFNGKRGLLIGGICGPFLAISVALTSTITAIAATAIGIWVLTAGVLVLKAAPKALRVAVLVLLPITATYVASLDHGVSKRVSIYLGRFERGDLEGAIGNRLLSYASALSMTAQKPLVGVGPGRFAIEQVAVATQVRKEHPHLFSRTTALWFDMVHNDVLEIMAEGGVPLAVLCVVFVLLYLSRGGMITPEYILAGALAAGFVTSSMLLFPLQIAAVYGTLALGAGVARGLHERQN